MAMAGRACLAAMLLAGAQAQASNFASCILDKLPGSANQATHTAVWQTCSREHPGLYRIIEQGHARGLLGFSDGNACTIKKASTTTLQASAHAIARACKCLYDAPMWAKANGKHESCEQSQIDDFLR